MIDFLGDVLAQHIPTVTQGEQHDFRWEWLAEGVLSFTPKQAYEKAIVLSAGVHGNETAPIELLAQLSQDVFSRVLQLKVKLMLILGNPVAIRSGQRYVENDMNRMFCGAHQQFSETFEAKRVAELEQWVADFFRSCPVQVKRYHYDLHTAIRPSLLPTFALFPYQTHQYDPVMLENLDAAELDALVYHNAVGHTFTQFSSSQFQAASSTLELGHAKPFGQNDLAAFAAINHVLRAVVSEHSLPIRQKQAIQTFQVVDSIIKTEDDFQLNLADSTPNFFVFETGAVIALQQGKPYVTAPEQVRILFPNTQVKKGLRAGLILTEVYSG
ncbi:succinylglutamate desuccinylase [Acinetobacter sp. 742879]|uniref:succinylglutamate desuccinylase n=1 Tax=Acinetobacter calcoaceticus/baumannii complex TaxID=909768 RepID=UPI0004511929|nr:MULTISPECIES: succinylglutamate desuccinylase [Acinetobacter calcoaceticus/baumannii complex]EXS30096.1 succinylglutamate desuccinylase [Acinetobacter sp. 742879]MDX8254585.1 succinylglutamate desuccinylase [Acinetobacter pittii]